MPGPRRVSGSVRRRLMERCTRRSRRNVTDVPARAIATRRTPFRGMWRMRGGGCPRLINVRAPGMSWYRGGMVRIVADARSAEELRRLVRDGAQPKYLLFWGHQPPAAGGVGKGCLSQWWPAAFTVDGLTYPSAEHFMMAAKAELSGDADMAVRIRQAPHPGPAGARGRRGRGSSQ